MLYFETIQPGTLSLLKKLMDLPFLKDFHLVGGTALSLKYGHRISIDINLFSTQNLKINTSLKDYNQNLEKIFHMKGKPHHGEYFVISKILKWTLFIILIKE